MDGWMDGGFYIISKHRWETDSVDRKISHGKGRKKKFIISPFLDQRRVDRLLSHIPSRATYPRWVTYLFGLYIS